MLPFKIVQRTGQFALDVVRDTIAPPCEATSRSIRRNGLLCILLGVVCFGITAGLAVLFPKVPPILLIPVMLAYALFAVGGYRMIRGKEPSPLHTAEISFDRVFLGIASILFCFGLLVVLGWIVRTILGV